MSQYTEETQGTPLAGGILGTNMETVSKVETQQTNGGTKTVFIGRLKTKAEIAAGATIFTIPLRHAPKTTRILNAFVEPAYRIEVTTGGLVKAVAAIPSGKEVQFDGLELVV